MTGWSEGDRVVSETAAVIDPQQPAHSARALQPRPDRRGYGAMVDGAMRRYVPVPARILHRMPAGMTFEQAALTEPCCVAYNAVVNNARIRPGDRVVVLGPGPIGILCGAIARLCGATWRSSAWRNDRARLDVARQYGCEPIVGDATEWARAVDGLGADGVVDATGVSAALATALAARAAGRLDQQGGLGPAAARLLARSARAEERHAAGQLQPQLADLGARDPADRRPARSTCGRSPAASGRWPSGTRRSRRCTRGKS